MSVSVNTLHRQPVTLYVCPRDFLPEEETAGCSVCLPQGNLILCIFDLLTWKCDVQGELLSLGKSVYAISLSIFYVYLKIKKQEEPLFVPTPTGQQQIEKDRCTHAYSPGLPFCLSNTNSARFSERQNNGLIDKLYYFYSLTLPTPSDIKKELKALAQVLPGPDLPFIVSFAAKHGGRAGKGVVLE